MNSGGRCSSRDAKITFGGEEITPCELEFVDTEPGVRVIGDRVEVFREVRLIEQTGEATDSTQQ